MASFELSFASNRLPVLGTRGMVASSQTLATGVGLSILREGGNAADAAVATAAALAVTEPFNTGIGGDCFALYYDSAGDGSKITALNGSGRAPAELNLERLEREGPGKSLSPFHAHTVTVPGTCAGWCDLLERHGSMPLDRLLAPAIELAEEGFPVAPTTAFVWQLGVAQLKQCPGGQELLIDGQPPKTGQMFRNHTLAKTLRLVAEHGRAGFYEGEVARAMVGVVREHGGVLSEADLAEHTSTWDEPISTVYRDVRVWECPPNGQGLAALLALNLLRGFDLGAMKANGVDRYHLMIEAMRLAFADARWYVSDPAVASVPVDELLSEDYAAKRRALIDPARANTDAMRGVPFASSDTVQFCVVDGLGNACSFINSNYMAFGTGLVPAGYGFPLQNRGHNFSLDPEHPNALAPRKRPYHTIIPGLMTRESDGSLYAPFGVMGGFNQPQGHLQIVTAMIDDGLDPQAALDRPRFTILDGTAGGSVAIEANVPEQTVAGLRERGHSLSVFSGWGRLQFGRGQVIRRDPNGVLWGGSDPRADGCAMTP